MTRWILGISLLILGIIGLFLPILQGIALIVAGLMVLGIIGKKIHHHRYHHAKSRTLEKRKK